MVLLVPKGMKSATLSTLVNTPIFKAAFANVSLGGEQWGS